MRKACGGSPGSARLAGGGRESVGSLDGKGWCLRDGKRRERSGALVRFISHEGASVRCIMISFRNTTRLLDRHPRDSLKRAVLGEGAFSPLRKP